MAVKPPLGMVPNPAHPLSNGLVSALLFNNSYTDYMGATPGSGLTGNPCASVGPDGSAILSQIISTGEGSPPSPCAVYFPPSSHVPPNNGCPITVMAGCMSLDPFDTATGATGENDNEQRLISYGDSNGNVLGFGITTLNAATPGEPSLFWTALGDHVDSVFSNELTGFAASQWMIIGCSQSAANARTFFKDGVFETNTQQAWTTAAIDYTAGLQVGDGNWNGGDGGCYWNGYISWIIVWLRALSQAEMLEVYNTPFVMFGSYSPPGVLQVDEAIGA